MGAQPVYSDSHLSVTSSSMLSSQQQQQQNQREEFSSDLELIKLQRESRETTKAEEEARLQNVGAQSSAGDMAQEHLNAIQMASEKRSRKMMMNLKREMAAFFSSSSISLEQQFRGFDANGDGAIGEHAC